MAAPNPLSRGRQLWPAPAAHLNAFASSPGGPAPYGRGLEVSQRPHGANPPDVPASGAPASIPSRYGRLAESQTVLCRRACPNAVPGRALEAPLGRSENGRPLAPPLRAWRVGQFGCVLLRQSARESELHSF